MTVAAPVPVVPAPIVVVVAAPAATSGDNLISDFAPGTAVAILDPDQVADRGPEARPTPAPVDPPDRELPKPTFEEARDRLREASRRSWTVSAIVSGAPISWLRRELYHIADLGPFLKRWWSMHVWHGMASCGQGAYFNAIGKAKQERDGNWLEVKKNSAELPAPSAAMRNDNDIAAIQEELLASLMDILDAVDANPEWLKTRVATTAADNVIETLAGLHKRMFSKGVDKQDQTATQKKISACFRRLRKKGVVLTPSSGKGFISLSDRVSALVAQLLQDQAAICKIAAFYSNNGTPGSTDRREAIRAVVKQRNGSDVQTLRGFGFLSLSHADKIFRAIDCLQTGFVNPDHKLNYILEILAGQSLESGGIDDIVNIIRTIGDGHSLTLETGWSRGLSLDGLVNAAIPGTDTGYIGATPNAQVSQVYKYRVKFSKAADGVKIEYTRVGAVSAGIGGGVWAGYKPFESDKSGGPEVSLGLKATTEYAAEDMLSFTLKGDTLQDDLKALLTGKLGNPYDLLNKANSRATKHEKIKTLGLKVNLDVSWNFSSDGKLRYERENGGPFYQAQVGTFKLAKEVVGKQKNGHAFSEATKHIYSEGVEITSSRTTVGVDAARGLLRARQTEGFELAEPLPEGRDPNNLGGVVMNLRGSAGVEYAAGEGETLYSRNVTKFTGGVATKRAGGGTGQGDSPVSAPPQSRLKQLWHGLGAIIYYLTTAEKKVVNKVKSTFDKEGRIAKIEAELTLPRSRKALTCKAVQETLNLRDDENKEEVKSQILDQINLTTPQNRADITTEINKVTTKLNDAKFGNANEKLKNSWLEVTKHADFTYNGNLLYNSNRQNFRKNLTKFAEIYKKELRAGRQLGAEGIDNEVDKLMKSTDYTNTKLWPVRGNAEYITFKMESRQCVVDYYNKYGIEPQQNDEVFKHERCFRKMTECTVTETRTVKTGMSVALPITFSSEASAVLSEAKTVKFNDGPRRHVVRKATGGGQGGDKVTYQ
ncbi:AvrE-family type 3 secretion system effector [Rhizobium sp. PDO1-076]|uniref:AvrE-family type 3 secretion system effector n=1 Tax=Rhizobium sp. PDO1-076 TaxID=1125979 RepID=UPI000560C57B|nr:AvrE-family type 3 secretion system effector [Rhizobium sp. PDO1-076]